MGHLILSGPAADESLPSTTWTVVVARAPPPPPAVTMTLPEAASHSVLRHRLYDLESSGPDAP